MLALLAIGLALLQVGSAQAAYVLPASQDYGTQTLGTSSLAANFLLSTSSSVCTDPPMCTTFATYTVDTSALGGGPGTTTTSGDFVIHNVDCQYPSATSYYFTNGTYQCHFQASFVPTASGSRSLTLTFPEIAGTNATLSLTGAGVAPPAATTPPPAPTGLRAAAVNRCKKKFPKGSSKRKKCLRRANQLPI
jgi:hypothetical protein